MTTSITNKLKFLDATELKILALFFMLLDHMWATIIPGNVWLTNIGRMAFPIFGFQIVEGFFHTSNLKQYMKRLLIFALISEIPFNFMMGSSWLYPFHQNVMFTLLLGLIAIASLDKARKNPSIKTIVLAVLALILTTGLAQFGFTDYGAMGVFTIIAFYVFRGFKGAWLGQLISLVLLNITFFAGMTVGLTIFGHTFDFPTQGYAIFSLIFIWLYNGKKGTRNKWIQLGSYWFYPVHMLVLYWLFQLGF